MYLQRAKNTISLQNQEFILQSQARVIDKPVQDDGTMFAGVIDKPIQDGGTIVARVVDKPIQDHSIMLA